MKTLLVVAFVVLLGWIVLHRERVYVRDPLAAVYRNDAKQSGVAVYINHSNDVLVERESEPGAFRTLVQRSSQGPGTPARLTCLHWMACLTEANAAPLLGTGWSAPGVVMDSREVSYVAADGARMRITLR